MAFAAAIQFGFGLLHESAITLGRKLQSQCFCNFCCIPHGDQPNPWRRWIAAAHGCGTIDFGKFDASG